MASAPYERNGEMRQLALGTLRGRVMVVVFTMRDCSGYQSRINSILRAVMAQRASLNSDYAALAVGRTISSLTSTLLG